MAPWIRSVCVAAIALVVFGCGGTAEIAPAEEGIEMTPEAKARMEAEMQKSFDRGKPKGPAPGQQQQ